MTNLRLISEHIDSTNRTLALISQSYTVLLRQQELFRELVSLHSNTMSNFTPNNNTYANTNTSTNAHANANVSLFNTNETNPRFSNQSNSNSYEYPVSISFNDVALSDLSSNTLFQNILHIFENTSLPTDNENGINNDNVFDNSAVFLSTTFGELTNQPTNVCPISLDTFNDSDQILQIRYCGHYFKDHTLRRWLTHNNMCPICRYRISSSN